MSTANAIQGKCRSTELSPLDMVELEAALEPFCPVATSGGSYRTGGCLPWCGLCASLLLKQREV